MAYPVHLTEKPACQQPGIFCVLSSSHANLKSPLVDLILFFMSAKSVTRSLCQTNHIAESHQPRTGIDALNHRANLE
jgi:hypothetical protein